MKPVRLFICSIISLCLMLAACDTASTPGQSAATIAILPATDTPISTPDPPNTPEPTNTPEPAATLEPSPTPEPTPTRAPVVEVDWLSVEGKTDRGYAYRGNPDAPITITDFSDFM